jgi:drug/metabolite transporter (DMT)-like permease
MVAVLFSRTPPAVAAAAAAPGAANGSCIPAGSMTSVAAITAKKVDPRLIASLAAVYVIWSSTYLAMQIAVTELPPMLQSSLRFAVAGLVLVAIAKSRRVAWPTAKTWLRVLPVGVLLFLCGNGFVAISVQSVSSGGAAVVCATMPLWTAVLAAATRERPSLREWMSLIVGFAGVVVLMGGPSLAGEPLHIALVVLAPICWAVGSILARRLAIDTFLSSGMQMIAGSAALAGVALARGERIPLDASATSWLALGYLCVFGSLIAFTAYNWLLRNARPVVATSYAYVNPPLAVLFGAVVSGEALGVTTVIANVLIIAAIALVFTGRHPR